MDIITLILLFAGILLWLWATFNSKKKPPKSTVEAKLDAIVKKLGISPEDIQQTMRKGENEELRCSKKTNKEQ